jgi:signal transduction histidine kinase
MEDMKRPEEPGELELVTATAQELKTPLTVIHGRSAMLESDTGASLSEHQREHLRHIRRISQQVGVLIDSLLHVCNLPFLRQPQPVQIHSGLHAVWEELKPMQQDRHISINWRRRHPLPPVVADPESVYQLLRHTMETLVAYVPTGSEIRMRTYRRKEWVVLYLRVPGEPIHPGEIKQLTSTIGKRKQPLRNQGDSTGLRWFIVQSIVEFYQGKLRVTPRTEDTRITIRLPVSDQLSLWAAAMEGEASRGSS